MKPRVWVLAGATATGKTDIAEAIAERMDVEIVCADARQVFRELETATGKPSPAVRASRPHHLFEMMRLGDTISAGRWARAAAETCAAIWQRQRTPMLVGGSGLYLNALTRGLHPEPGRDPEVRAALEEEYRRGAARSLHARLAAGDPETARRLPPTDRQRVLRALEVLIVTKRPLTWWHRQMRTALIDADVRMVEIRWPAAELARRIEQRTPRLFSGGLIEEVEAIRRSGGEGALRALRAIGYDEALDVLDGRCSVEAAVERTSVRTRQLAKRQRTWFRHQFQGAVLEGERADFATVVQAWNPSVPRV